jgi:hypothetical protein
MSALVDMTRRQVGAWRVIWRDDGALDPYAGLVRDGQNVKWICRCACGTLRSMRGDVLRQFRTLSCGCMNRDEAVRVEAEVRRNEQTEWVWTN